MVDRVALAPADRCACGAYKGRGYETCRDCARDVRRRAASEQVDRVRVMLAQGLTPAQIAGREDLTVQRVRAMLAKTAGHVQTPARRRVR